MNPAMNLSQSCVEQIAEYAQVEDRIEQIKDAISVEIPSDWDLTPEEHRQLVNSILLETLGIPTKITKLHRDYNDLANRTA